MQRRGERLKIGDVVEDERLAARGVVLEVLDREPVRVFRDGCLEVHEVARYAVLLASGRTVVVNDRAGRLQRVPAPMAPPPPSLDQIVARRGAATPTVGA